MNDINIAQQKEKIALEILSIARHTLLVNMRFLGTAFARLRFCPYSGTLATNSETIFFDADHVINLFKQGKEETTRAYLHMLLHCIFLHPFINKRIVEPRLWNLACDIAVEAIIGEWNLPCTNVALQQERNRSAEEIKQHSMFLTAEKIYFYLTDGHISEQDLAQWEKLFCCDDHQLWFMYSNNGHKRRNEPQSNGPTTQDTKQFDAPNNDVDDCEQSDNTQGNDTNRDDEPHDISSDKQSNSSTVRDNKQIDLKNAKTDDRQQSDSTLGSQSDAQNGGKPHEDDDKCGTSNNLLFGSNREEPESMWKEVANRLQTDLETFSKNWSDTSGSMVMSLKEVNRERYDYAEFLRKFTVLNEAMKINDDEFDYVFYTYGLRTYGNLPLVEPLEYKDIKQIKDFVIAIDTSGSVQNNLVQKFIQKTYNILKQQENFAHKINLHIVQCDAKIQNDTKITNLNELENCFTDMKLYGFGGTDFRPVFNYIDQLVAQGELIHLKGLIYFTDGNGIFPERKPPYKTAFVFVDDNYNNYDVPAWAIKLVLETKDI